MRGGDSLNFFVTRDCLASADILRSEYIRDPSLDSNYDYTMLILRKPSLVDDSELLRE